VPSIAHPFATNKPRSGRTRAFDGKFQPQVSLRQLRQQREIVIVDDGAL
jgi:hypothetical protein